MKSMSVFFLSILTACGSSDSDGSDPTGDKVQATWSVGATATFMEGCTVAAVQNGWPNAEAKSYCACYLDVMSRRYFESEWEKDWEAINAELKADGSVVACSGQ